MTVTEQLEEKYPQYIIDYVRLRLGLNEDDTSKDHVILGLSQNAIFKEVLNWNGLLGFDTTIKEWILDIFEIDLNKIE